MTPCSLAELARKQIEFARNYTLSLLEGLSDSDWFRVPGGGLTHIAWQVGHLAASQYLLTLFRLRGKREEDTRFIAKPFLQAFGKGSTPNPKSASSHSLEEIRATFHGVYQQMLQELPKYADSELTKTVIEPYAVCNTLLGSLLFCAQHEMLHAGQIGLLRRRLGLAPIR